MDNNNKLVIFSDGTYESTIDNNINKTGLLSPESFDSLKHIIDNRDNYKDSYCDSNDTASINYNIDIFDKKINLGNFEESCVDPELFKHVNSLISYL